MARVWGCVSLLCPHVTSVPFWGSVPQKAESPSLDFLEIQSPSAVLVVWGQTREPPLGHSCSSCGVWDHLDQISNRGAIPPSPVGFGDLLDQSWVVALGKLGIMSGGKSCQVPPKPPPKMGWDRVSLVFLFFHLGGTRQCGCDQCGCDQCGCH